jgi:hypothetical protein
MGMIGKLGDPDLVCIEPGVELVVADDELLFEIGDISGEGVNNVAKLVDIAADVLDLRANAIELFAKILKQLRHLIVVLEWVG